MSYVLGIDIGGSTTSAAVCRRAGDAWGAVQPLALDAGSPVLESTLELIDGTFVAGARVDGQPADAARVARDLVRRVGDDAPLVLAGASYLPHTLVAALARWVVEVLWHREECPAEQVVLTHPTGWGPYRIDLLGRALADAGLPTAALLPAALAVAESHEARGRVPDGIVAVYRLGGQGVEATLLERPGPGVFWPLGTVALDGGGGDDLDDALFAGLRAGRGMPDRAGRGTADHAGVVRPGQRGGAGGAPDPELLRRCAQARHRLSTAAEVTIDLAGTLAAPYGEARVTRAELDRLLRPVLRAGVDVLLQAIDSYGAGPADLSAVLLAGGAARTPLVAEMLAEILTCPVLCEPDPSTTVATGATLAAHRMACGDQPLCRRDPATPGHQPSTDQHAGGWPAWSADTAGSPAGSVLPPVGDAAPADRPHQPPMQVTPLDVAGKDLVTVPAAGEESTRPGRRGRGRR